MIKKRIIYVKTKILLVYLIKKEIFNICLIIHTDDEDETRLIIKKR